LIAYGEAHRCRVFSAGEQPVPRLLQPNPLLILQGAHSADCPEMTTKRRNAHSRYTSELAYLSLVGVVGAKPSDGPADL
jgi:hypothetical protein